MIDQILERAADNPAVIGSLIALGIFYLANYVLSRRKPQFPAPKLFEEKGNKDLTKLHSMVQSEFQLHKNEFFKLGELYAETVILPVKFVEELKSLPADVLSFEEVTDDMFLARYNLMSAKAVGGDLETVIHSVKNNLTRNLGNLMGDIYDEMLYAFETEMPPCDDWTEVNINDALIRIVALVSGRIFIGNPINRDEDYLKCIILFTLNVFNATPAVRKYPAFLRWTAKYISPEVKAVHESLATMERIMEPVLKESYENVKQGTGPRNMHYWVMANSSDTLRRNLRAQAHMQLGISMAAIHTTSMTTTHCIFDLAAHPEHLAPLREEVAATKATESTPYLSKTSMPKMKKLDSFLRESQRMNPLGILNFRRKVLQDITLHDGTRLPKGTYIAVASSQIARDPDLWEEPDTFDGFRFAKMRAKPGSENRYQFVTTGPDNLQFGHGVHACPGRFFANNEIKLIFAHLFENYDIKFPEGITSRPKNLYTPGGYAPDRNIKVLMKKRAKA